MENKIIKLARKAIELEPVEQEITQASAHYVALEQYVLDNPADELTTYISWGNKYYRSI